jgi:SsrA-binding protein
MAKKKKNISKDENGRKTIEVNKKARRDYEIVDTFEAGIQLLGSEVKSIRDGGISLRDSYIRFKNGECLLVDCHISPYKYSRRDDIDPYRPRKLLLHKREIERLSSNVQLKGLTAVPLKLYFNEQGRCKLELALGRGKKLYDKRQDVKRKDAQREMQRALKNN